MSRLETVANISIIVACAAFSVRYASEFYGQNRPAHRAPPFQAGDTIKDTPELGLERAHLTLVLVTRSNCHFCSASMPFYKLLTEAAKKSGVRFVGATSEDPLVNRAYLSSNEATAEAVISADKNKIKAPGTPTLILVRSDGRVVNSWVGQLPEAREKDVLKAIEGGL